ncbi:MAG: hypothetical protein ACYSTF_05625 [Planctomycetota bacterium]|jgi:hypothetical protein
MLFNGDAFCEVEGLVDSSRALEKSTETTLPVEELGLAELLTNLAATNTAG